MPSSMAPSTQSNSEDSPASWPAVRGRPRDLAQRPLPSMTIATWPGTLSAGISGGRAPDGCGFGFLTSRFIRLLADAEALPRPDGAALPLGFAHAADRRRTRP